MKTALLASCIIRAEMMGERSGIMWVEIIWLLPAPKVREALMCILSFKERT
ncbi:MAG: hypothetical protein MZU95_05145 [Desulfomicrobium escambiense]|nr:hypothetical protein [Desulfomicrobium escambiense]